MKAVILAAGKGVRLLPLTKDRPKPMVEMNGVPFIDYLMDELIAAGVKECAMIVGYQKKHLIEHLQGKNLPLGILFLTQSEQKGTGDALSYAKSFCGDENFLMLGADNFFCAKDLKNLTEQNAITLLGFPHNEPEKYGALTVENEMLVGIREKESNSQENEENKKETLINTGAYYFTKEIWGALTKIKPSPRGELELTDAVEILAKEKKVNVKQASLWLDMGTKEDIKVMEKELDSYCKNKK